MLLYMLLISLKSKIHRATVTRADLNYEGSLTVDRNLMTAAGFFPHEKVQVVNINNGCRFETYLIEGKPDSGMICLNGGAARLGCKGDLVIIMSYALLSAEEVVKHKPIVVLVDKNNRILK